MGLIPLNRRSKYWSVIWLASIWAIWLSRNDLIFNYVRPSAQKIFEDARFEVWLWIKGSIGSNSITFSD
ncbi:unnamed protein product [Lupinus luteus]|uniref:Uncharacterized protein n=1 Tax=Lupinus luteus TaxID=3873 RepID=A0AAV1XSR2_LUPLU